MANFSKRTNIREVITVTLVYFIFFITGILSYQDYGISVDEWDLRVLGFINLKYIAGFFSQNISAELDKIILIPKLYNGINYDNSKKLKFFWISNE